MTPPCILLVVVAAGLLSAVGADNCLNPTGLDPRPITKKEINLVSSFRPSHRMVTLVFSLYLKEYLNYSDVNIIYEHDQFDGPGVVANFSGRFTNSTITLHANLEAWSYPGSVLVPVPYWGQVADCGDLVLPGGRFFWKTSNHPEGLDYRQLFQSDIVAELAFDERFSREQVDNWTIKHYPCPNTFSKCALLLAENYSDTSWVVQDIEKLQMAVEVAWLGDRFEAAVRDLAAASNRPLLILTYTGHPLEEGLAAHWGSVRFPPCEVISPNNPSVEKFCPYDLHRLVKLIKVNLQTYARPVYNALHHLEFDREQYRELVLIYANHSSSYDSLRTATCAWMRNNIYMLEAWSMVPPKKETVYISGIFPVGNFSAGRNIDSLSIIQAAELAIKAVNQNSSILPNHFLDLLVNNGNCSADAVMRTFINTVLSSVYPRMVGILGPACSDTLEPLAGVTKYFPTVVISYSAEGASLNDRDKYPYFFRTISENHQYRLVYLELLKLFKWNRIATLSEDGQKYTEYISHTQDLLQKHNIHFIANPRFPRGRASLDYGAYLRELRDARARIIIADIQEDAAVALMCEAYKHNMTAYQGYVWFLPSWLSKNWWNVNNTHCKKEELVMAIDGYLALSPREYAASNEIMQENITVGQWLKKYEKTSPAISPYGGYAYDAVWVYAIALHKLLIENATRFDELHANYTTIDLVKYISQTDFQGVSGRIKFSLGSSRSSEVLIFQWLKSDNYSKREVGYFKPDQDAESGVLFMHNVTKLIWLIPGGKTPDDGALGEPECVFQALAEGLSLSCEAAIVVVNVAGFGFLGIILVVLFFIAKKRYERKQESIMRDLVGMEVVTAKSLDRWEFPRDRVVINRKLGQGAFGAVYGGEAQLSDKNWTAVAVKTLKPGSTTEIKLDFLSEAEVMKRFDHTNIVKLLGVCTKNEPVYTIMEFMLYGDLKTFLLARRHLVTSPSEESEEVSPKRLTSMVNDVARALSYLAELKYVHRDVACRNCLVNASRLVKLADFGMTRPIYESDYYKFSRKGMLPVRWMAPESLALGIFTPSSDVWSYGVLLYEVMTFGSFPFQGMSNSQVLEHVKNGGTLVVPSGAKPQLEALIKSCWNPEHKKRPQAREIVDFLANNPRLLAPCLDAPIASVQFEEPQGELPLPESIRKVSITLRRRLNSSATEPLLPPYLYGSPQPSTAAEEDEEDVV